MGNSIRGHLVPVSNITANLSNQQKSTIDVTLNQPVINLLSENPDAYETIDLMHTTEDDFIIVLERGSSPKKIPTSDLTIVKTNDELDEAAALNSYQFIKRD